MRASLIQRPAGTDIVQKDTLPTETIQRPPYPDRDPSDRDPPSRNPPWTETPWKDHGQGTKTPAEGALDQAARKEETSYGDPLSQWTE